MINNLQLSLRYNNNNNNNNTDNDNKSYCMHKKLFAYCYERDEIQKK